MQWFYVFLGFIIILGYGILYVGYNIYDKYHTFMANKSNVDLSGYNLVQGISKKQLELFVENKEGFIVDDFLQLKKDSEYSQYTKYTLDYGSKIIDEYQVDLDAEVDWNIVKRFERINDKAWVYGIDSDMLIVEYSSELPNLINCFQFEYVSFNAYEKIQLIDKRDRINIVNELKAYNSIGFLKATVNIKNNFHALYPKENNKEIDGAFMIILCDNGVDIAFSYICGDWGYRDKDKAGFGVNTKQTVVFRLFDKQTTINPHAKYTVRFAKPNLWLVKQINQFRDEQSVFKIYDNE